MKKHLEFLETRDDSHLLREVIFFLKNEKKVKNAQIARILSISRSYVGKVLKNEVG